MPWVNIFFSEKTILKVLSTNCEKYPILYTTYPGIKENPKNFTDLRRYKDLNYLTHKKLRQQIKTANFKIQEVNILYANRFARLASKFVPGKFSLINDILSKKISLTLEKY